MRTSESGRRINLARGGARCLVVLAAVVFATACEERKFTWAFAQNLDGSFHPSETCRESLAQSIYEPANRERTERQGTSNIFLYTGLVDSYRIYAYHSQVECETALTGMVARRRSSHMFAPGVGSARHGLRALRAEVRFRRKKMGPLAAPADTAGTSRTMLGEAAIAPGYHRSRQAGCARAIRLQRPAELPRHA